MILFSQKVPASQSPPGSPLGPYGERYLLTGHLYISLDISLYLKGPKKRAAPTQTDAHSRALFNISFRVSSNGALPAPILEPSFIHHSKSPVYEPPLDSWFPLDVKGLLRREMPTPRAFLNMPSKVPSKGALPRGPLQTASSERNARFLEPSSTISQSPW